MTASKTFPALLESFFADQLVSRRCLSQHTIASYRDTWRLLLRYMQERLHKAPSDVDLPDLSAPVIVEFLMYLEECRGNKPRSRNARLAAIRSFFRYVALEEPAHAGLAQRILAIPTKRWHRRLVSFLSQPETKALLNAPDRQTAAGRRDYALLYLAIQTGLRVSELTGLKCKDIRFDNRAYLFCHGKGRKERCLPLTRYTAKIMRAWLQERGGKADAPLFTNVRGMALSRDGISYILSKHVTVAARRCPTLLTKRVSPHVLRHTAAVNLLQAGVDRAVIALWLGHESVESTQMYLHADAAYKEKVLAKVAKTEGKPLTYKPEDHLLAFLNNL